MAGRPRLYPNAAEKTRAYRERQQQQRVNIHRADFEQIEAHLGRLMNAVDAAKRSGNVVASSLKTVSRLDLLSDLAAYFEECSLQQKPQKRVK